MLEKGAQDRAYVITAQQHALMALKKRVSEAEVRCGEAEGGASGMECGGRLENDASFSELSEEEAGGGGVKRVGTG